MPSSELQIVIVGAGIAGLSAGISCRRAGHTVRIYERSALKIEVGAAINMCPNASRGLLAWGLDPVGARFVKCQRNIRAYGNTLEKFWDEDLTFVEGKFGAPSFLCHRVDLHDELKRLATQEEGEGKPVVLHLSAAARSYNPEAGSVTLSDGSTVTGDLVIAADGVHSQGVEAILGTPNPALPIVNYNFAYRFLISTQDISSDPETAHFLEGDNGKLRLFVGDGKRLVWYPCRDYQIQNFVALFHNEEHVDHEDWQTTVEKSLLLERYKDFHPKILKVLEKATDIKQWPLLFRSPVPSWHKGKLVLIGDAAHPMLPHQGQGGCQAIEDSVAIGLVLAGCSKEPEDLLKRIRLFEEIRMNRASAMQMLSNAGQDEPQKIQATAAKYIGIENVPKTPKELYEFNFGYDVVKDSVQRIQNEFPEWTFPENFFEKKN